MSLKKMMLLASALAALVAFAAPATSQATFKWSATGTTVLTGSLATNIVGSPVINGPCEVEFEVATSGGTNEGAVTGGEVVTPCDVQPFADPACNITAVHFANLNWPVTTTTTHPREIEIHNVTFTNTYSTKCQELSLPAEISAAGTVTGTFDTATQCITFTNAGDLTAEVEGSPSVVMNGSVCRTSGPTLH